MTSRDPEARVACSLTNVDAIAEYDRGSSGSASRFREDTRHPRADEQIARPLQIEGKSGRGVDGLCDGHARGQRQQGQSHGHAGLTRTSDHEDGQAAGEASSCPWRPRPADWVSATTTVPFARVARQGGGEAVGGSVTGNRESAAQDRPRRGCAAGGFTKVRGQGSEGRADWPSRLRRIDLEVADVDGGRRMRQRPDRDVVGAGGRQLAHALQGDARRRFGVPVGRSA